MLVQVPQCSSFSIEMNFSNDFFPARATMIFAITADVGLTFEDVSVHFVETYKVPDSPPQSSTSRTRIHLESTHVRRVWNLSSFGC